MQKRRKLTKGQKTDLLIRERWTCKECKQPIQRADLIEWDHTLALARGGTDELENIVPLHRQCHLLKTFHPRSRATTLASDLFEIAKTKRLIRKREKPKVEGGLKSRGFSKRFKRKFNGEVEER
tara:strand:+ start:51 stop:422 length:372 start_codon:yes stop_codon:yes gene_type:complete